MPSKSVSRILTARNSKLQPLLERAFYLEALTRILREALDPVLAEHITLTNLHNDTVTVAADTPAWLTKIRYLAPIVLQHLRQQSGLEALNTVRFKVLPLDQPHNLQPTRRATLSSSSSQILKSAAEGIDDPDLADALRRLSRQTSSSQND